MKSWRNKEVLSVKQKIWKVVRSCCWVEHFEKDQEIEFKSTQYKNVSPVCFLCNYKSSAFGDNFIILLCFHFFSCIKTLINKTIHLPPSTLNFQSFFLKKNILISSVLVSFLICLQSMYFNNRNWLRYYICM